VLGSARLVAMSGFNKSSFHFMKIGFVDLMFGKMYFENRYGGTKVSRHEFSNVDDCPFDPYIYIVIIFP
jgi:hypothetical protein